MPRVIWKGAISFGLVHVPVGLYPASQEIGINFDWLDKRTMDPVGYKRINKRTGKEIERDDIVKGIKQADGDYVVLSEEEIKAAYPVSTQTIDIETFVEASEIPFTHLEKPYYLAPLAKGEKVYALLRDAMAEAKVIGVARVVMHTKERLAALIPDGDALLLNTIRWAEELRPRDEIPFPAEGKGAAKAKEGELKMALQLIRDMTGEWNPAAYTDKFTAAIHALAAQRVKAGETEKVTPLEDAGTATPAGNVVDLTELLKKSLASRKSGSSDAGAEAPAAPAPLKSAAKKTASTRTAKTSRSTSTSTKAKRAA
jgi:DNA end-binding protein Ku